MHNSKKRNKSILVSCLLSQIVWIVSAMIMLIITCAVSVSADDPFKTAKPLCMAVLYITAVIGGISAVKFSGDGIVSGILSGVFTSVLVMILSFIPFPESGFDSTTGVLCALLVIPASVLGSILGHKKETKKTTISKMKRTK